MSAALKKATSEVDKVTKALENATKKGKKAKAAEPKDKPPKEKGDSDVKSNKFSGLLKMPFKKKEKRQVDKQPSDDDIELEDGCSVLEAEEFLEKVEEVKEDTEDTSMTEEWASFHEVHPNAVELVGVVIKAATPKGKEKGRKGVW